MENVADHLEQQAVARHSPLEKDSFGRSAFNRYYYATYLLVRAGLAGLRAEWAGEMPHATIPELLRGTVCTELKRGHTKAVRTGDSELAALCSRAITASKDLAKLMDEGRAIRVVADYRPDVPISFAVGSRFKLNTIPVEEARIWAPKARAFLKDISSAWRQVHA